MSLSKINNLFGLVLIGGQSTRMKTDKSLLRLHDHPQAVYAYDLLSRFCEKVFISCRPEQGRAAPVADLAQIHDDARYQGKGPLAGILSAMETHLKTAWLVLACDLPFVSETTLEELLKHRTPEKIATAFRSSHDGLPEPLCTVYEPQALPVLQKFFNDGVHCPRKILMNSDAALIDPTDKSALDNINHPDELEKARTVLKRKEDR